MGDCRYCGKSAGFLRREHRECADRHASAQASITEMCISAALHGDGLATLPARIRQIASAGFIEMSDAQLMQTLADGWCSAAEAAIEDHSLSSAEKSGLNRYRARFNLNEGRLDAQGHFSLFKRMALLNSLIEQRLVPRFDRRAARAQFGRLPFNLMKSEELLWLFSDVDYIEQVTRREYRGGSMGVSFRVAKGVYVRPGAFRGRSVSSTSMERTDSGMLGITTKHIYFNGESKSFRVRLEKIVSFEPYSDGLGIMRDTARAKPEAFTMGEFDAWFLINVIDALLDMDDMKLPKEHSPTLDDIMEEGCANNDNGYLFAAGASASF